MSAHVLNSSDFAKKPARYSTGEEIANAVTHGIAALMSIAGLAILVGFAVAYSGSPTVIVAVSVFGASMIFLYVASTLYHAIPNQKAKQILTGNYDGNLADLKGKTWEDVIIEAENFAFFKGAIRFLFRNENGAWDWTDFDTKWRNAQRYFGKENGLYKNDSNLLRFFISQFNIGNEDTNWSLFWEMVYDNEDSSWRNLLINRKWQAPIHKLLLNSKEIVSDYRMKNTFVMNQCNLAVSL